jgi:hypothetical protein
MINKKKLLIGLVGNLKIEDESKHKFQGKPIRIIWDNWTEDEWRDCYYHLDEDNGNCLDNYYDPF